MEWELPGTPGRKLAFFGAWLILMAVAGVSAFLGETLVLAAAIAGSMVLVALWALLNRDRRT